MWERGTEELTSTKLMDVERKQTDRGENGNVKGMGVEVRETDRGT